MFLHGRKTVIIEVALVKNSCYVFTIPLPTLKPKKCHRDYQDDTKSPLVSNNHAEIRSRSQSTHIVTGQQARPFPCESSCDKASTGIGCHEEEAPILDDRISHEVYTTLNVRRTDDKDKNMNRCAVLPDHIAV